MDVKKTSSQILFVTATNAGVINIVSHPNTPIHEFKATQFVPDMPHQMLVRFGGENQILYSGPFKQPRVIFYDYKKKQVIKSFILQVCFMI